MRTVTWDGLDFAALQMLMVGHRWNGQPGVRVHDGEVSILMSPPGNPAGLYRVLHEGQSAGIGADGLVYVRDAPGELLP
jgi:hypothetical protein